jgi:hypothetical protein
MVADCSSFAAVQVVFVGTNAINSAPGPVLGRTTNGTVGINGSGDDNG